MVLFIWVEGYQILIFKAIWNRIGKEKYNKKCKENLYIWKKKSHLVIDEKVEEKKLNCRWIIDFSHNFTCQIVKKGAKKKKKTLISFYVISKNKKIFFFTFSFL